MPTVTGNMTIAEGGVVLNYDRLGAPYRVSAWFTPVHAVDGASKEWIICTPNGANAGFSVLKVDPDDGSYTETVCTSSDAEWCRPYFPFVHSTGRVFILSAYDGHLWEYDIDAETLTDRGAYAPTAATYSPAGGQFCLALDEDSNGDMWIGYYPWGGLSKFTPSTNTFYDWGTLDANKAEDYVYAYINPYDDELIVNVGYTTWEIWHLNKSTQAITLIDPPGVIDPTTGFQLLVRFTDTHLWIEKRKIDGSEASTFYRVQGSTATEMAEPTWGDHFDFFSPTPSGTAYYISDTDDLTYREITIDGTAYELDYTARNPNIFCIAEGPETSPHVYMGFYIPDLITRYNTTSESFEFMGRSSTLDGEIYAAEPYNGELWMASYSLGHLSVVNPDETWDMGTAADNNPRDFGQQGNLDRPGGLLCGVDGKVWTAGQPIYGVSGAPLCWHKISDGTEGTHDLFGDLSTWSLAANTADSQIIVGSNVYGGSGTEPSGPEGDDEGDTQPEAKLYRFNYSTGAIDATIDSPSGYNAFVYRDVEVVGRKCLCAISCDDGNNLVLTYDLDTDSWDDILLNTWQWRFYDEGFNTGNLVHSLLNRCLYDDGGSYVYVFAQPGIWRIDKTTWAVERFNTAPVTTAGPVVGGYCYWGDNQWLCRKATT